MTTSIKYIGTLDPYFEIGVTGKQGVWHRGQISAVPDGDAALLIASKVFMRAESPQALMASAGDLAYAAVATTTGTPGEVRKLIDGPDAGLLVVWGIPVGKTTYTWCLWFYPSSSYL